MQGGLPGRQAEQKPPPQREQARACDRRGRVRPAAIQFYLDGKLSTGCAKPGQTKGFSGPQEHFAKEAYSVFILGEKSTRIYTRPERGHSIKTQRPYNPSRFPNALSRLR